jgi:glycosyltransferase 2 family protein
MSDPAPQGTVIFRRLKLAIKIIVSGLCIWYVSTKIDFSQTGRVLSSANWILLFFALVAFVVSKIFASVRLNIYFHDIGIRLTESQNLRLYWQGMFYNLFLPGSISGDAYKVMLISKKFGKSFKKTTAAVLIDRISGLLGLAIILSIYACFVIQKALYVTMVLAVIIMSSIIFYLLIRRYFKHFYPSFFKALYWSLLVQGSQVVAAYLIMAAIGVPIHVTEYIFIFLVSSIAAVLPLTIGGLGIRELVFLEGARYFGLLQETSVVISVLFYLITVLSSLAGLVYVFRDPLKIRKDPRMSP